MRVIGKDVFNGIASGETVENMLNWNLGAGDYRLAHHDLGGAFKAHRKAFAQPEPRPAEALPLRKMLQRSIECGIVIAWGWGAWGERFALCPEALICRPLSS